MGFWQRLSQEILFVAGRLFVGLSRIEIGQDQPDRLLLRINGREMLADGGEGVVYSSGRVLVKFEVIQSIEVEHIRNGKRAEWWTVNLCLVGNRRVRIGETADDVQASRVAARLGSIMCKPIHAVVGWDVT